MKSILISLLFLANSSFGQQAQTVGDVLGNIKSSKGQNAKIGNKSKTNLPKSANVFRKRRRSKVDFSKIEPPPSDTFVQGVSGDRAQLEQITDKGIRSLFKLTQSYKNSPNRGELWLRLAELYSEKAALVEYRINRRYEAELKAFERKQRASRPNLNLKPARQYNLKAIELYEWFVRDFPKDPKIDQALFFLGFNNVEVGRVKKGVSYYQRLTKNYPKSVYVSEANFALAEYFFENNKWKPAYKHYSAVIRNQHARLNSFAQYKAAWCLFRMGSYKEAFNRMVRVIKDGRKKRQYEVAGMKQVNAFKIEQEALRDFVVFYAEAGNPKEANRFFADLVGRPKHISYVEKLGYYYSDKGRREDARKTFNDLVIENPTAPKAFEYKYQVVLNYAYASKSRIFRQELYAWIKQFGPQSAWARANGGNAELVANANKLREATLRNYVIEQHQTAQNSRAQYSQTLARQGYQLYLVEFPSSPHVPDMRFYYAELLYDLKDYNKAADEYLWVSRKSQSKYKNQAEINAVLSIEKLLPTEAQIVKKVGKSIEPHPLPASANRFIAIADQFRKTNPKHEKVTEITFRIARLYYLHNHFDKAEGYFFEIVKRDPRSKYGEYSANLILDGYNLRRDYKGLDKAARKLLTYPEIASSKLGKEIRRVLENSNFQMAQNQEGGKDYKGSAASYAKFAKSNPNSELATKALFNAGVNYERAGDVSQAIPFYEGILARKVAKSDLKLKRESRLLLARLYEKTGQYEKAAKQFEIAAAENRKRAGSLYFNAATIYSGMNYHTAAIRNYERFLRSTKGNERKEAHFEIASINQSRGRVKVAIAGFKDYIKSRPANRDRVVEAQYRIAKMESGLKYRTRSLKSYAQVIGLQKSYGAKSEESLRYASIASLELQQQKFRNFIAVKIPANPRKQKAVVDRKLKTLKQFNSELAAIIKMNSPTAIIGSLVLLGKVNHHMYDAFASVPKPKGLTKEELAQYNAGVQKLIEPYKKSAIDAYRSAIGRSRQLQDYPVHLAEAFRLLKHFVPNTPLVLADAHKAQFVDWSER